MSHADRLRQLLNHPDADQREQGAELAIGLGLQDTLLEGLEWEGGTPLLPNRAWLALVLASDDQRGRVTGLPWLELSSEDVVELLETLPALTELNLLRSTPAHLEPLLNRPWKRLGVIMTSWEEDDLKALSRLEHAEELDVRGRVLPNLRRLRPARLRFAGQTTDGDLPDSIQVLHNLARDLSPRHMRGLHLDELVVAQAGHFSQLPPTRLLRAWTAGDAIREANAEEIHVLHSFSGDAAAIPRMTWASFRNTLGFNPHLKVVDLWDENRRPPDTWPSPLGVTTHVFSDAWADWVRARSPWRVRLAHPAEPWRKISVIKTLRHLTGLGLLAAKRHCDPLPGVGVLGLPRRTAELLAHAVECQGHPVVLDRW